MDVAYLKWAVINSFGGSGGHKVNGMCSVDQLTVKKRSLEIFCWYCCVGETDIVNQWVARKFHRWYQLQRCLLPCFKPSVILLFMYILYVLYPCTNIMRHPSFYSSKTIIWFRMFHLELIRVSDLFRFKQVPKSRILILFAPRKTFGSNWTPLLPWPSESTSKLQFCENIPSPRLTSSLPWI